MRRNRKIDRIGSVAAQYEMDCERGKVNAWGLTKLAAWCFEDVADRFDESYKVLKYIENAVDLYDAYSKDPLEEKLTVHEARDERDNAVFNMTFQAREKNCGRVVCQLKINMNVADDILYMVMESGALFIRIVGEKESEEAEI